MPTSRRRKVSISELSVSVAANFQRRDLIDGVVQSDFSRANAGASATPDRSGSVSKDLRLVACIVSVALSLPDSALYWPINRSLLGTNDFSEAGFRVSVKISKIARALRNID